MADAKFRLEVSYSETTGEPVAAYLRVRDGQVSQTKEISEGIAFADYAANGFLLGIELLAPCKSTAAGCCMASLEVPIRV